MEPQTYIRTDIPEMTVIFRHKAAQYKIDSQIRYDAVYIKDPDLSDTVAATAFYNKELLQAGNKGKSFIVMNFNQIIADYFNYLLSTPDTLNYKNWIFLSFFHDDEDIQSEKAIDKKNDILEIMQDYHFIKKYTIPPNANLTFQALLPVILETWGFIKNSDLQ
jgi:hypothetical protein